MPDYLAQEIVSASGTATALIKHDKSGVTWEVQQISLRAGSSTGGTMALYLNGNLIAPTAVLVPLDTGAGISASGPPYVYLDAVDQIECKCFGLTAGDTLTVRAQYREYYGSNPMITGGLQ